MDKGVAIAVLCVGVGGMLVAVDGMALQAACHRTAVLSRAAVRARARDHPSRRGTRACHAPGHRSRRRHRPSSRAGLALEFSELRAAGSGVLRLTAVALPICFVLASVAAHVVGQFAWGPALLFGRHHRRHRPDRHPAHASAYAADTQGVVLPQVGGHRQTTRSAPFSPPSSCRC